jgi:hypothetical protein
MDQVVSTKHVQKPLVILFLDLSGSFFKTLINDLIDYWHNTYVKKTVHK